MSAPLSSSELRARAVGDGPDPASGESGESATPGRLRVKPASAIKPEPTEWLWRDRIPLGSATLLAGRQGLGKSTLTLDCAAKLSNGTLEGDLIGEASATLVVSYEDNAASTIVPRLVAAGADRSRVHLVTAEQEGEPDLVSLPGDVWELAESARACRARLLIVDPFVASLGGGVDAHRDQDVRRALAPLARLAEEAELAVLLAIHFNKGAGTDVLLRISGSTAFSAGARSVLAFGPDPDDPDGDERVLSHEKCNVGPRASSLAYRIEGCEIHDDADPVETSRLVFLGESELMRRIS